MSDIYAQYLDHLRTRKPIHEDALPLDAMVQVNRVPCYDGIVYAYGTNASSFAEQHYLILPAGEEMIMVHEPHHLLKPIPAMQPRLF